MRSWVEVQGYFLHMRGNSFASIAESHVWRAVMCFACSFPYHAFDFDVQIFRCMFLLLTYILLHLVIIFLLLFDLLFVLLYLAFSSACCDIA